MVDVVVFAGLSIDRTTAFNELPAIYRAPATQGDMVRAVLRCRPRVIGIIDGFFETEPPVWHKEILWAMFQGVHVFGAAGIGALRAAELTAFGMEGVGRIFEDLRDGVLEDDDEVAVLYERDADGYKVVSDAMVNIRATVKKAVHADILDGNVADTLIREAKQTYYKDRLYDELLNAIVAKGIPKTDVERLRRWLPKNRVDQMRLDGLAMLRVIKARLDSEIGPMEIQYPLAAPRIWHETLAKLVDAPPR